MAFTTRRGRPRTIRPETDLGTPELHAKRQHQLTTEPMDLCLEKNIITAEQHRCGLHLRWLYTLRYGAPSISCHDITGEAGRSTRVDDPAWRTSRELEYHEVTTLLHRHKRYEPVMNIAVYNQLPVFLNPQLRQQAQSNTALLRRLLQSQRELLEGFECLQTLWCKKTNRYTTAHGKSATSPVPLYIGNQGEDGVFTSLS